MNTLLNCHCFGLLLRELWKSFAYQGELIQAQLSLFLRGGLQMGCLLLFCHLAFCSLHYEAERQDHGVMALVCIYNEML